MILPLYPWNGALRAAYYPQFLFFSPTPVQVQPNLMSPSTVIVGYYSFNKGMINYRQPLVNHLLNMP